MLTNGALSAAFVSVIVFISTGCGSSSLASNSDDQARKVAVSWAKALYADQFAEAAKLVAPNSMNAYTTLVNTKKSGGGHTSSSDLHAGDVKINGPYAQVELTGRVCASDGTDVSPPSCRTNTNPAISDPQFEVSLVLDSSRGWLVDFTRATAPPPTVSGGITASPSFIMH